MIFSSISFVKPVINRIFRRRWVQICTGLLLLWSMLGWLAVPSIVRAVLPAQVLQHTGRVLEAGDIRFSPFSLTLTISDLHLKEADQKNDAMTLSQLKLNISLASVWHRALVVDGLELVQPQVRITRVQQGNHSLYNFSDILDKLAATPASPEPARFALHDILIHNGTVRYEDRSAAQTAVIDTIELGLPFISSFPHDAETHVEPALSFMLNGAPVRFHANSKPFSSSMESRLDLGIQTLDLAKLQTYLPLALPVRLQSAKLDSSLSLVFRKQPAQAVLEGSVALQQVHLQSLQGDELLRFGGLKAELASVDLHGLQGHVKNLQIDQPEIWLTADKEHGWNWLSLLSSGKKISAPESVADPRGKSGVQPEKVLPLWKLDKASVHKGSLHLTDSLMATRKVTRDFQWDLSLNALSTAKDAVPAVLQLSLNDTDQGSLKLDAQIQPVAQQLNAHLQLSDWQISPYQPWLDQVLRAKLSGAVDASVQAEWQPQKWSVQQSELHLHDIQVQGSVGDGSFALTSLDLNGISADSEQRQLKAEALALDGLRTDIRRGTDGTWLASRWLTAGAGTSQSSGATAVQNTSSAKPWQLQLGQISLAQAAVSFTDQSVRPSFKAQLDQLSLQVSQWQSDLNKPLKVGVAGRWNQKGNLKLDVDLGAKLADARFNVDARSLPVASLYPYVSDLLNVEITQGNLSLKGSGRAGSLRAAQPELAFDGQVKLQNFQIFENGSEQDFLEWKNITADGLKVQFGARNRQIELATLTLQDFFARAVLSEKGKLNLSSILVRKTPEAAVADVSAPAQVNTTAASATSATAAVSAAQAVVTKTTPHVTPVIRIRQTRISGGNINFTDHFIRPNYKANLTGVSGTIGLLASDSTQPATIELTGKVDDDAPLLVSGALNPLANPIFLDIKGSTNGLELTRLTPYSAKYAGYAIEKGKLSMQVAYRIEQQQLKAENEIVLDQLTFGEKVESPDATRLPVMLAVALLRDNQGKIAINLPVSGSLSDPQFSVSSLIFKVFMNVITKAVTSPFALLGSLFGGGEELSFVGFEPGQALIADPARQRLDQLGKALLARQSLHLEITGKADASTDADGVRAAVLERRLQEAKWRDALKKDKTIRIDDITLSKEERHRYLAALYSEASIVKPRNVLGLTKSLPDEEMSAMLKAAIPVDDESLRQLAQKRADLVRDYLEDVAGVPRERLFLIAPRINRESKDSDNWHRVDFSLK
ncbi:DUF748 domain-containing protein [Undibacterium luofuense]|uniref:DUF748 domain-containing protein n=1 Tax=Undibacterium luofuense TaxID=2828733 RepID=A0A941DN67_9BURK|nr:DUF748 domain-containing protein [Undibacterium luofuense]MBR7782870.1 DUF748 domain-containing protein [Undibacterium luofuense]